MRRNQAKKSPVNDFKTFVSIFRENPYYGKTPKMEIVDDTENTFELNITECFWATTFRHEHAGDFGYAAICHWDFAWVQGFNPKIKMIRDITLMQGNEYCNHRYIWEP